jgi:uridine kinase
MSNVRKPLIIAIAGGTGAGKTTISRAITSELPAGSVAYLQHDAYYCDRPDLSAEERAALNYDHPESLDNTLLISHLNALREGLAIERPNYDFVTHRRFPETTRVEAAPVVVIEGILLFAIPDLVELFDIKLFIDTPADIRVLRRIRRDIEHRGRAFEDIRQQYYATVRPMHETFVEPAKYHADLIVPEGANYTVAIDLIVQRIRGELRSTHAATK